MSIFHPLFVSIFTSLVISEFEGYRPRPRDNLDQAEIMQVSSFNPMVFKKKEKLIFSVPREMFLQELSRFRSSSNCKNDANCNDRCMCTETDVESDARDSRFF